MSDRDEYVCLICGYRRQVERWERMVSIKEDHELLHRMADIGDSHARAMIRGYRSGAARRRKADLAERQLVLSLPWEWGEKP